MKLPLTGALEPANNKFIGLENRTIDEAHELRQETVNEVKKLEDSVLEVEHEQGHDLPSSAHRHE